MTIIGTVHNAEHWIESDVWVVVILSLANRFARRSHVDEAIEQSTLAAGQVLSSPRPSITASSYSALYRKALLSAHHRAPSVSTRARLARSRFFRRRSTTAPSYVTEFGPALARRVSRSECRSRDASDHFSLRRWIKARSAIHARGDSPPYNVIVFGKSSSISVR